MTSSTPGPNFEKRYSAVMAQLGPYPHAKLNPLASGIKKQSTRMIKCTCDCCGYVVRASRKQLKTGLPRCPKGGPLNPDCDLDEDEGDGQ